MHRTTSKILPLLTGLGLSGCGSDSPSDTGDGVGTIEVTAATTGDDIDPAFTVLVGGQTLDLASNGSLQIGSLTPGVHAVSLDGVADNCSVAGDNPQSATVAADQTTTVAFVITCVVILPPNTLVAADRVGNFYTIDETTGAETLFLDTSTDDGLGGTTDVGVVSSMHWIPTTSVWWLGTGGNGTCTGCIQTLDLTTGVATTLIDVANGVSGLAVHPTTEKIYTFESDGTNIVFEVDATTGVLTPLFTGLGLLNGGGGTTFSQAEALFVAARNELWSVDLQTGAPTLIGAMTYTGFPAFTQASQTIGSMATRPSDGVVFGLLKDGGNSGALQPTFLVQVNLATAEITNVGVQTHLMDGLAFIQSSLIGG